MRSLVDLLSSADGRAFLESRGVFDHREAFVDALRPPARADLAGLLGLATGSLPVYVGQQVQPDYQSSVVAKFRAARDVGEAPGVEPVVLWLDTDRAGSHKGQTTLSWLGREDQVRTTRLAARRWKDLEVRFVPVAEQDLGAAMADLAKWVGELPRDLRPAAGARRAELAESLLAARPSTLAEANRAIASFLLDRHLGFSPVSALASDLTALVAEPVAELIGQIDDVISVFNGAIEALAAQDVDPVVKPLGEEYLPLQYACPDDGVRRRLMHERRGADHFAVAACTCGRDFRFHLGSGVPSLGELAGDDRWSPDVTLPVYLNAWASGV